MLTAQLGVEATVLFFDVELCNIERIPFVYTNGIFFENAIAKKKTPNTFLYWGLKEHTLRDSNSRPSGP